MQRAMPGKPAKVEAGRITISPAWFEMVDLFSALRGMFKPILATTEVSLIFPDGHGTTYHILGDWDSDLPLGIISRSSRLAQSLMGHVAGDQATIPGEDDGQSVEVKISSVQPLPRSVLEWALGR